MVPDRVGIPSHPVRLELTIRENENQVAGLGEAENLLGKIAPLALVRGPQRGEVVGVVIDGTADIQLKIPPFGSPPAPASVLFRGKASENGLEGTCRANLAGTDTAAAPCTLAAPSPPDDQAVQGE